MTISHKKQLSQQQKIELIKLFKFYRKNNKYIAERFEISERAVKYYKTQYLGTNYTDQDVDLAVRKIEQGLNEYPYRDYKRQEKCEHKSIKVFAKCTCSKCWSENDEELVEILEKLKKGNLIEVQL